MLYSELFNDLVFDMIPDHDLEDWDNRSGGDSLPSITSAEECKKACDEQSDCMQSLFKGDECVLGKGGEIVFGVKQKREEKDGEDTEESWVSSWNKTRIADWVSRQSDCETITWPDP